MEKGFVFRMRLVLAFIAVYFIWGTTYLAIRLGLEDIGPFVMSALRYGASAVILTCWCFFYKHKWPDRRQLKPIIISGVLMLVGGSGLVVYAEQYISSGLAAVVIATEPLLFVLLEKDRWREYFANPKIIWGLITGFIGIILFALLSPAQTSGADNSMHLWGILIVLCGAIFWVGGALYANRKLTKSGSGLTATTIQLTASAVVSLVIATAKGEWTSFHLATVSALAWGGLVYITLMGTLVAYLAFLWLMKVRPPALVSTHTLVNPVIAVVMGWIFLHETIDIKQALALTLTIGGVFLTWSGKQLSNAEQ